MQHTLTTLELHRRLSDGRFMITGIHKKPVEHPVQLAIEDLSGRSAFEGMYPRGMTFLVQYTADPCDVWGVEELNEAKLGELIIDPVEIFWLSLWAQCLWDMVDDSIEIAEEPTPESMAAYWRNRSPKHANEQLDGAVHNV